jgi:large subunit ribosomal protein L24
MSIRKGDVVQVLAGDDRGKRGKVLSVHPKVGKCVVEGVNLVYKHVKPNRRNPQGGRLSKEMPLDLSNVALIDPQTNKPTRVGVRILTDGSKERYSKKSGASLGKLAPPKSSRKKLAAALAAKQ